MNPNELEQLAKQQAMDWYQGQTGTGGMAGMGGGFGGYGGNPQMELLLELLRANPTDASLQQMALPIILQSMDPAYQQETSYLEEDRNTQKAYDLLARAETERDPQTGDYTFYGRNLIEEADRLLGIDPSLRQRDAYGGVSELQESAYGDIGNQIKTKAEAAYRKGDTGLGRELETLFAGGETDPRIYETWRKPIEDRERWEAGAAAIRPENFLGGIGRSALNLISPYHLGETLRDFGGAAFGGDAIRRSRDYSGYGL
jgi:hypothetical protein